MQRAEQPVDSLISCVNASLREGAWEREPHFVLAGTASGLAFPGGSKQKSKQRKESKSKRSIKYVLVDHLSKSKFSARLACL